MVDARAFDARGHAGVVRIVAFREACDPATNTGPAWALREQARQELPVEQRLDSSGGMARSDDCVKEVPIALTIDADASAVSI